MEAIAAAVISHVHIKEYLLLTCRGRGSTHCDGVQTLVGAGLVLAILWVSCINHLNRQVIVHHRLREPVSNSAA